jgi:NADH dehydrogenase
VIVVAGATGLVGRAFVEVVQQGRRPWTELSRQQRDASWSEGPRAVATCDVADAKALAAAVSEARAIVHLAGVAPAVRASRPDHEVAAMRALLELAKARAVERFVFLSAHGAAPGAAHPWLRAKGEAESLLRASGVPFVILRASLVTSAESPLIDALAKVVATGERVRLPLLRAGRFLPIAAGDAAIALATALDHHSMVGRTVDLGTPPALSLDQLLALVAKRLGRPLETRVAPWGGRPLARLLADATDGGLSDVESWLRLASIVAAPDVGDYARLVPMKRTALADEMHAYPWGPPPPRPGDPLPMLPEAPAPGLPMIIPGERHRDASSPSRPASSFGRTDPFGRPNDDRGDSRGS